MLDKRTAVGKMIDKDRVVYQCIKCNRKFIGDINTNTNKCPSCKWKNTIVVLENMAVITKGR